MTETQAPGVAVRRLRRSRSDRVIGGVCGGLGEYLGVDAVLIRLAAVLLVFAGGAGVVAYIVGWIIIPEADEGAETGGAEAEPVSQGRARVIAGAVLVCLGGLLLLDAVVPFSLDHRFVWPVLLIVVGAAVIARGDRR
jgi:phage shock protein C